MTVPNIGVVGTVYSFDGYEFSPFEENMWRLNGTKTLTLTCLPLCSETIRESAITTLAHLAQSYSADHTSNMHFHFMRYARWYIKSRGKEVSEITFDDFLAYRADLAENRVWYAGSLRSFLSYWNNLACAGLEDGLWEKLSSLRIAGNEKGVAVRTRSPNGGALTDIELQAVIDAAVEAFENGRISLEDISVFEILRCTGRRPQQLADTKLRDVIVHRASTVDVDEVIIRIPRRKQSRQSWRSEFRPFLCDQDLGHMVLARTSEVRQKGRKLGIPEELLSELPIFPDFERLQHIKVGGFDMLPGDYFHRAAQSLAKQVRDLIRQLEVHSERTGRLELSPVRLRRTLGTRASQLGCSALVIAELLDHSDDQNTRVYIENRPEEAALIDQALSGELAGIARTFAGKVARDGADMQEPYMPVSHIPGRQVGGCVHSGPCGLRVPFSCYTCRSFRAWRDADHQAVRDDLRRQEERVPEAVSGPVKAAANLVAIAVEEAIELCAMFKDYERDNAE